MAFFIVPINKSSDPRSGDEQKYKDCKLDSQLGPTFSSQTGLFSFLLLVSGLASRGHSLRHTVLPHILGVAVRDDGAQLVNVFPQLMHLQQLGPQSILHQWLLALLG